MQIDQDYARELIKRMNDKPYDFVLHAELNTNFQTGIKSERVPLQVPSLA